MTQSNYFDEFELKTTIQPASQAKKNSAARKGWPEQTDIPLWLSKNSPRNLEELKAVRYTLYHRCSRADFKVSKRDDETFVLSGRQSSVFVVSNRARRYLLWKLRILAREEGWVGRNHNRLVASG